MYVIVGDCIKPIANPINEFATKISNTLVALYIINQAIVNGTLTAIIVRFRPNESVSTTFQTDICTYHLQISVELVSLPVTNDAKILPIG